MANPSSARPQEDNPQGKNPEHNGGRGKQAADKARDIASNVAEQARNVASSVADKARDTASRLGQKAQEAGHAVAGGMHSLAGSMRENMPQSGMLGTAGSTLASGLDSTGRYIEEEGLSGMANDVTKMIRRNPIPSMLVGVGLGFLLARVTSRS